MNAHSLKIKVCGMRDMQNITELVECSPDYIGFIFYEESKRYVSDFLDQDYISQLNSIKKVGVFVNPKFEHVLMMTEKYKLNFAQLHGDESADFCDRLSDHVKVIKAFGVDIDFNFSKLKNYKSSVEYFLFDTKTQQHGGSGESFDWKILEKYDNEIPFFLSGGIDVSHIDGILQLEDLNIHAIDVNSRFEISPGVKDIAKIKFLKDAIRR